MTSKISFYKLLINDIKQRSWVLISGCILQFIVMPVMCLMNIQASSSYYTDAELRAGGRKELLGWISEYLTFGNSGVKIAVLVLAVICGVTGYAFLHSKEQLDFYHSLPIARKEKFAVQYISGLLIFTVPYIICYVQMYLVAVVKGYAFEHMLREFLVSLGIHFLFFVFFYSMTVLAMVLTGKTVIGVMGAAVFFLYPAIVEYSIGVLSSTFFQSAFYNRVIGTIGSRSPLGAYLAFEEWKGNTKMLAGVCIVSICVILLSYVFYRRRPSEAAGRTMAYRRSEGILKVAMAVPIGIYIGSYVNAVMYDSMGWFVVTSIMSAVLLCCMIEFIYHMDIKTVVKRWKSMLVSVICVGLLFGACQLDVFRYDSYLPKEEEVKEIELSIEELESYISYPDSWYEDSKDIYAVMYSIKSDEAKDIVYKMIEDGIKRQGKQDEYEDSELLVRYKLRNGQVSYRSYYLNGKEMLNYVDALCQNEDVRKEMLPIETLDMDKVYYLELQEYVKGESIVPDITKKQAQEILKVYKEEVSHMSLKEMNNSEIIGYFQASVGEEGSGEDEYWSFNIYENLSDTLALLKKYGCELKGTDFQPEEVRSIEISQWDENTGEEDTWNIDMKDQEEVEHILEGITSNYGIFGNSIEEETTVEVTMKDGRVRMFDIKKGYLKK